MRCIQLRAAHMIFYCLFKAIFQTKKNDIIDILKKISLFYGGWLKKSLKIITSVHSSSTGRTNDHQKATRTTWSTDIQIDRYTDRRTYRRTHNINRTPQGTPGNRSTPEARWARKKCTPWPDRFSVNSGPLSSLVTRNCANSALTRLLGIQLVLSTSRTDRGVRGGSGSTIAFGRKASVGQWHHQLPQGLWLGG